MLSFKKTLQKYLPIYYFKSHRSYSQEGEDMILNSFYEGKKGYKGFYVDIGAHHPYRFSNTLFFYKRGWKGINVEPTPGAIRPFKVLRSRDINLPIGVSNVKDELTFYCFNEPALNSFSKEVSEDITKNSKRYKLIKTAAVTTLPLADIFDNYLPPNQEIDFITIDVEGLDLVVLHSNNWEKYKPNYIAIEDSISFEEIEQSGTYQFLKEKGYTLVSKTLRTAFYKKATA